ncbi:E3.2.1.14 [Mytilus edulis]|uniref:E3.2.1.14 n=1 Tax=Mytilus edulis TaxID=6550 RepID=A0A8S3VST1_MYTED|nr:E3.2.1.14 [Mytilus edulis]
MHGAQHYDTEMKRYKCGLHISKLNLVLQIEWLVSEGYGGAMVWALHHDDVNQTCSRSNRLPCTDKISGIYADPANCSKFYNCEGVAFHINCPINLIYNSNIKYCDYHSKLVCVTQADVSTKAASTFPRSSSSVLPISTSSYFTSPGISSDLTTTSSFSSTSSIQKSPSTQSSTVTSTSKSPSSSQNPRFTSVITGILPTKSSTVTSTSKPPSSKSKVYFRDDCQNPRFTSVMTGTLPTQSSIITSTSKPPSSSQNPRFTSVMTGTLPTITRTTTSHVSSIITSLRTTAALPSTTQSIPLTSVRTPVTTSITSTLTTPTSTSTTESPSIVPPQTTIHTSAQPLVTTPKPVPLGM